MPGDLGQALLGGLAAFAEAMLGFGIVLPGEVMVTGIATTLDGEMRIALFVAVTLGATTGDHVNYWLGRGTGARLRDSRPVRRIGTAYWDQAVALVQQRGAWAVFVSRLLPVVRTLMAAVAGVSQLRYRSFAVASLTGSAVWAALWIAAGEAVGRLLGQPLVLAAVVAVALSFLIFRRGKRAHPVVFAGTTAPVAEAS